jgi:predicted enzyme related to lactoylglutathione lyase
MSTPSARSQVVWCDIPCRDLDRAITFYSSVLGCEVARQEGPGFSIGVLPHEGAAVGGCLFVSETDPPSARGVLIYLNCQDRLDEAEQAVTSLGGKVLEPRRSIGPHGFRTVILDSEGNRVALHSM